MSYRKQILKLTDDQLEAEWDRLDTEFNEPGLSDQAALEISYKLADVEREQEAREFDEVQREQFAPGGPS
jgi:hypothetical protein